MYAFVGVDTSRFPDFDDQAFASICLKKKRVLVAPGTSFQYRDRNFSVSPICQTPTCWMCLTDSRNCSTAMWPNLGPWNCDGRMSAATRAAGEILAGGGTVITATHRLAARCGWNTIAARRPPDSASGPVRLFCRSMPGFDAAGCGGCAGRQRPAPAGFVRGGVRLLWRRVIAAWREHSGGASGDVGVLVPLASSGWRLCQTWGISGAELQAAADSDDARAAFRNG
jgi:hypothetical protein